MNNDESCVRILRTCGPSLNAVAWKKVTLYLRLCVSFEIALDREASTPSNVNVTFGGRESRQSDIDSTPRTQTANPTIHSQ